MRIGCWTPMDFWLSLESEINGKSIGFQWNAIQILYPYLTLEIKPPVSVAFNPKCATQTQK